MIKDAIRGNVGATLPDDTVLSRLEFNRCGNHCLYNGSILPQQHPTVLLYQLENHALNEFK